MYLLDKLSSILNSDDRSSTLYSFAYYVYTHLFEVSDMTINELSGNCMLSNASVSRMITKIGFANYKEFREMCEEITRQYKLENPDRNHFMITPNNIADVMTNILGPALAAIRENDLDCFLSYLAPGHTVAVTGMVNMRTVAVQIQQNLHTRSGYHVIVPSDLSVLRNLSEDDRVIILSVRGNYIILSEIMEALMDCKAGKLLVTTTHNPRKQDYPFDHVVRLASPVPQYLINNYLVEMFVTMALCRAGLYD
jgi:DNA-binding MurR/RpiR family transcriptional regulator